jgi:hypothetical protein
MADAALQIQLKGLQETLRCFSNHRVLRLNDIYHWDEPDSKLPPSIRFNPRFDVSSAEWNIQLKSALHNAFRDANETNRRLIAEWVVKEWGGVKKNKPGTLATYVAMTRAKCPKTPWKGVASYSKIMAVFDPKQYAIFDARVASSLNAIQMLDDKKLKVRFPIPSGQNIAIKRFAKMVSQAGSVHEIGKEQAYREYLVLITAVSGVLKCDLYKIEMLLFGLATRLARRFAPATAPPA